MGIKNNRIIELKGGDVVTLRNGDVLTYDEYYGKITNEEDSRINYNDDLTHKSNPELDIIKIERPVELETIFDSDEPVENGICSSSNGFEVNRNGKSITIRIDL